MIGLLIPVCLAACAATIIRGPGSGWPSLVIRWWPLAVAAFAVELLIYNPPLDRQPLVMQVGPWVWVACKLALLAVVLRTARATPTLAPPLLLAAVGLALNTVVIAANGGYMPQSAEAALSVWGERRVAEQQGEAKLRNVTPLTSDSSLPLLADVLPQPAWLPRPNVISIGDVALSLGIAGWVFVSLAPRPRFAARPADI